MTSIQNNIDTMIAVNICGYLVIVSILSPSTATNVVLVIVGLKIIKH